MRYEVPQFIDVKDKIFGPFTLPQFIFLAGGGGIGYAIYRTIPSVFKYPIAAVPILLGVALAFLKINGRPFIVMMQAFLVHVASTKLYTWQRRPGMYKAISAAQQSKGLMSFVPLPDFIKKKPPSRAVHARTDREVGNGPRLSESRLRDLAWNLDVLDEG